MGGASGGDEHPLFSVLRGRGIRCQSDPLRKVLRTARENSAELRGINRPVVVDPTVLRPPDLIRIRDDQKIQRKTPASFGKILECRVAAEQRTHGLLERVAIERATAVAVAFSADGQRRTLGVEAVEIDRKSTRLNSSH